MPALNETTRLRLRRRDGDRCTICGLRMDFEPDDRLEAPNRATIDHIIPRSKGGTNDWSNLRLAHARCNRERGASEATGVIPCLVQAPLLPVAEVIALMERRRSEQHTHEALRALAAATAKEFLTIVGVEGEPDCELTNICFNHLINVRRKHFPRVHGTCAGVL